MYHNHYKTFAAIASIDLNAAGAVGLGVDFVPATPFKVTWAAAGQGYGVLMNKPKAGESAELVTEGEVEVRVGLAVVAGSYAMCAASGWFIGTNSTTAQHIMGRFITSAASGMLATLDVRPFNGPTA